MKCERSTFRSIQGEREGDREKETVTGRVRESKRGEDGVTYRMTYSYIEAPSAPAIVGRI